MKSTFSRITIFTIGYLLLIVVIYLAGEFFPMEPSFLKPTVVIPATLIYAAAFFLIARYLTNKNKTIEK